MAESKPPEFSSLEELTNYFESNDMGDHWQMMQEVDFEISIVKKTRLIAIEETLAERVAKVAREKNLSPEVLIQAWLEETLTDKNAA